MMAVLHSRTVLRRYQIVISIAAIILFTLASHTLAEQIELELMINNWNQTVVNAIEKSVQRFEAANPQYKVTVTLRGGWDDYVVRVVGGVSPDVVATGSNIGELSEKNLIQPLDRYITNDLWEAIVEPMWGNATWMGHIYGVPALEQGPRLGFVWNSDILAEAGMAIIPDEVLTWNEFYNLMDKLTKIEADGTVTRMGYDPENGQNSRLFTAAPSWAAYDYLPVEGEPQLNHPGLVNMLETTVDRVYRKYPQWRGSGSWYDPIAVNQSVAVTNLGVYAPGEVANYNPDVNIVVSWPPENEQKKVQQLNGWALSIPVGANDPDVSYKLIEFVATDIELQLELFYSVGFLGGMNELFQTLAREVEDPSILWYLQSVNDADYIDVIRPDPFHAETERLFNQARGQAYSLEQGAQNALDEVQRVLLAIAAEKGRL